VTSLETCPTTYHVPTNPISGYDNFISATRIVARHYLPSIDYLPKRIKRKPFNESNIDKFNNAPFTRNWADLFKIKCPNEANPLYFNTVNNLRDEHIPE